MEIYAARDANLSACPMSFPRKTNISTWAGSTAPGFGTYLSRPIPAACLPFGVRIRRGNAVDCTGMRQIGITTMENIKGGPEYCTLNKKEQIQPVDCFSPEVLGRTWTTTLGMARQHLAPALP